MTRYIIILICMLGLSVLFPSCEDFLDKKDPNTSYLQESDIFDDPVEFKTYATRLYDVTTWVMDGRSGQRSAGNENQKSWTSLWWPSGESVIARRDYPVNMQLSSGDWTYYTAGGYNNYDYEFGEPWKQCWEGIYQSNLILSVVDNACKGPNAKGQLSERDRNQIKAEAYLIRAFSYGELIKRWGGVPYFDQRISPSDDMIKEPMLYADLVEKIVADCDAATALFPEVSYYNDPKDMGRYAKSTSMAYKSRVLQIAASPLNNPGGDAAKWERAAKAAWDVIKLSNDNSNKIGLYQGSYNDMFYGKLGTIEDLWPRMFDLCSYSQVNTNYLWVSGTYSTGGSLGNGPTQETVDKFEMANGLPVVSGYNTDFSPVYYPGSGFIEQNPYKDRDPRFYKDILYHGCDWVIGVEGQKLDFRLDPVNGVVGSDRNNPNVTGDVYHIQTGYAIRKMLPPRIYNSPLCAGNRAYVNNPFIRMAEMYLNYAEAVNEAYKNPSAKAPGASLTAIDAINMVRQRVGHVEVPSVFTADYQKFQDRVRNEFAVELCFECHYWFDLIRWKNAVQYLNGRRFSGILVILDTKQPTGFRFERATTEKGGGVAVHTFTERQYLYPFRRDDLLKNPKLKQNPGW